MEGINVDINFVIKEYQSEVSKLYGEIIMLRALVNQLQNEVMSEKDEEEVAEAELESVG